MNKVTPNFSHLNIIKAIYYKPTADITLNDKSLKAFPLVLAGRQKCSLSSLLFHEAL